MALSFIFTTFFEAASALFLLATGFYVFKKKNYRLVARGLWLLAFGFLLKIFLTQMGVYTTAFWGLVEFVDILALLHLILGIPWKQ